MPDKTQKTFAVKKSFDAGIHRVELVDEPFTHKEDADPKIADQMLITELKRADGVEFDENAEYILQEDPRKNIPE